MKSRVSRPTTESSQTYGEAVANSSHKPTRGSHSVTSDTPYVLEQQNRIAQLRDQQTKTQSDQTGLPAQLKAGIESLSGMSMDHVQVHYDSAKPADVGALAYTQGSEIHLGPGQEKHLPHEAWHVVQQAQQNVRATTQRKATPINDDDRLEREADQMGTRAMQLKVDRNTHGSSCGCSSCGPALQLKLGGAQSSRTDATSGKIVQLKCGKCGSNDHRTNNCPRTPQQLEEHKEKVKTFQKLKNEKPPRRRRTPC